MPLVNKLADFHYRNDPVRFARRILGFDPDENQASMLRVETHRAILACHRQWGKTTTAAIKAIHHAFHHPDSLSVIVAPTLRQGGFLLQAITRFARQLGLDLGTDAYNRPSLVLPNRARVIAAPASEDNIRGFSAVSLLLVDEAARVADEVWAAILPAVTTVDGAVWLMSTPNGKLGFFADLWFGSDPAWHRVAATAETNSRIPRAVLESQRRSLTRSQYAQDYLCEFGEIENQVFANQDIDAAFTGTFEPLDKDTGTRTHATTELCYYVGLDLGQRQDYTAITVLELHIWNTPWRDAVTFERLTSKSLRVRHLERLPLNTSYPDVLARVAKLIRTLGQRSTLVADATGLGAPFIDFLKTSPLRLLSDRPAATLRVIAEQRDQLTPHGYLLPVIITAGNQVTPGPRGTYHVPKLDLIETLMRMFESRRIEIAASLPEARALRSELLSLRRDGNTFEPYSERVHDDLLMSLALAAWRAGRQHPRLMLPEPEPKARRPA